MVRWGEFFKFIDKIKHFGVEDLPQEFLIEHTSRNVEFIENKAG